MAPTARQLREKAEKLFVKAARWRISRRRSRRLHSRAISYLQAARLAERREREGGR